MLSFSTAVVTAVAQGGIIVPCAPDADTVALASRHGGVVAVRRERVPELGRFSLSPLSFLEIEEGAIVVLPSPNGGACSSLGSGAPYLFAGALVNASSVGSVVARLVETTDLPVTVVAAGERYEEPSVDGVIRFAVEDYLGAGAILGAIVADKSPEAMVCESAFVQLRHRVGELLWGCESGRELRDRGAKEDVHHASQLDHYGAVPVLSNGCFIRWMSPQQKALAYVTRARGTRRELLVFEHVDHPEAGVQVPAGTIEAGEDPAACVVREVTEETGLASLGTPRHLTTHTLHAPWAQRHHERHVYHIELTGDAPDEWTHAVTGGGDSGLRFACRWHDLAEPIDLAGAQGAYLEFLL